MSPGLKWGNELFLRKLYILEKAKINLTKKILVMNKTINGSNAAKVLETIWDEEKSRFEEQHFEVPTNVQEAIVACKREKCTIDLVYTLLRLHEDLGLTNIIDYEHIGKNSEGDPPSDDSTIPDGSPAPDPESADQTPE